jgi:hypothetical protein
MPSPKAQILAALITACACVSTPAAMYRWVDENGVTVYSQTPPPSGDAVKLRKRPPPPARDVEAARQRTEQQREGVFDQTEAEKQAATEQAMREDEAHQREKNCAAARDNLETYQNLGPRRIRTADGRYLRLSEDEVRMEIDKAQAQIEEFCR